MWLTHKGKYTPEYQPWAIRATRALRHLRLHPGVNGQRGPFRRAALSLARLFRAETGKTAAKVIEPLEANARLVGAGDPERMRRAFVRVFGLSPQANRRLGRAG